MPTDTASAGQESGAPRAGRHPNFKHEDVDGPYRNRQYPKGHLTSTVRIPVQQPFHGAALLQFLSGRAIAGVEAVAAGRYARTVRLPHGAGAIELTLTNAAETDPVEIPAGSAGVSAADRMTADSVTAQITVTHPDDLAVAIDRCRHLLDADAPARAIAAVLSSDPALAAAVQAAPGLRLPGTVNGPEILFRALVGQQISVAAARTKLAALTAAAGERFSLVPAPAATDTPAAANTPDTPNTIGQLTHLFPSPAAIATFTEEDIAGPRRRAQTIIAAAADMASGALVVDGERDAEELTADLVARPGIGPWTAGYVAMRVLREPDVLLTGDLALRHGAAALNLPDKERELAEYGQRWQPFRSYAGMYLWRSCPPVSRRPKPARPHRDPA